MTRKPAFAAALARRSAALPLAAAPEKRAVTIDDLHKVKGVAEPVIAPDGQERRLRRHDDRPAGRQALDEPLARRRRREERPRPDGPRQARHEPGLLARRRDARLPLHPLRHAAGLVPAARRGRAREEDRRPRGRRRVPLHARRQAAPPRRRRLARLRRRPRLQPEEGRGDGEGEDEGGPRRRPLRQALGHLGGREADARPPDGPRRPEGPARRPDARRLRLPRLLRRRRRRLRRLARRQGARLHVEPRREPRLLDERRRLRRPGGRHARAAEGAEEPHREEPGLRRLPELLARREVDRLPDAADPRLRVGPLPPRPLRPGDRREPRPHRDVRLVGRRLPLPPGREDGSSSSPT